MKAENKAPVGITENSKLTFKYVIIFFVTFSLLDPLITIFGLNVGCVEINNVVLKVGIGSWALLRTALIGYLVIIFLVGYRFCKKHSAQKALTTLTISLFIINIYIGAVVFSGFFSILTKIL